MLVVVVIIRSRRGRSSMSFSSRLFGPTTLRRTWPTTLTHFWTNPSSDEDNAMDARQAANGVFDGGSWVGEGADAARAAYNEAASIKFNQAEMR